MRRSPAPENSPPAPDERSLPPNVSSVARRADAATPRKTLTAWPISERVEASNFFSYEGQSMKSRSAVVPHSLLVTATALALIFGCTAPANAAVTSAGGSISCAIGQQAYVRVDTTSTGTVTFKQGNTTRYTSTDARTHVWHSGVRTLSWKVTSTVNMGTIYDGCTAAPVR